MLLLYVLATHCCQCWLCDGPADQWGTQLVPDDTFPAGARYGAYLRCILPQNRIGDYVHCTGRVVNIIFKRLLSQFADPCVVAPLKHIIHHLTAEAQGLPVTHRLAPRHTKVGSLDLTASTLFVQNAELHARIGDIFRQTNLTVPFRQTFVNLGAAIQLLFRTLHGLHSFWRQKTDFLKASWIVCHAVGNSN